MDRPVAVHGAKVNGPFRTHRPHAPRRRIGVLLQCTPKKYDRLLWAVGKGRTVPLPLKVIVEKTVELFEAGPTRAVGDDWGPCA